MAPTAVKRLVLIRHSMPAPDPEARAEHWELGPEGRTAARSLTPLLAGRAYYIASDEPKAVQTLREIAGRLDVATDAGFGEVRRPSAWLGSREYQTLARAYVEGTCHDGWEAHARVVQRFDAAVTRHATVAAARGSRLVVGTHGLALTVWLASRLTLAPSPASFWEDLRFPDFVDVDLAAGTTRRQS